MLKAPKSKPVFTRLILAAALPLAAPVALANGLAITGDAVTIAGTGYTPPAFNLATNPGKLPDANSVPTGAITSNLSFSFDLAAATGKTVADGAYTFEAGIYVDQDGSQRRLEISISNITMNISGNGSTLAGNVAAGTSAKVSGRSAAGDVTAQLTLNNSLFAFNDSSLAITLGTQITEIQGGTSPLDDLTTTFSANASYEYGVYLKQTGGPAGLTFGLTDGTTIFGCESTTGLLLAGQPSFMGATALKGRLGVGQAAGSSVTALPTGTANCSPTPALSTGGGGGGGGGGGSTTPTTPPATEPTPEQPAAESAAAQTTALSEQVASGGATTETATQLSSLSTETATTATNLAADLATGGATVEQATALVTTLVQQMTLAEVTFNSIRDSGGNTSSARATLKPVFLQAFRSLQTIIKALPSASVAPTTTQITSMRSELASGLRSTSKYLRRLIASSSPLRSDPASVIALSLPTTEDVTEITDLVAAANDSTDAVLSLAGADMDASLATELGELSQVAVQLTLDDLAAQLGGTSSYVDDATTQALLAGDPALLSRLASLVLVNINDVDLNQTASSSALQTAGLTAAESAALSAKFATFVNANEQVLDTGSGTFTLNTALDTLLGVTSSTDSLTNTVTLTNSGSASFINVQSVSIAPSSFPVGTHSLPDGSSLVVGEGLAIKTVPALANIVTFASAVSSANATLTYNDDGSLLIKGSDFTFTGRPGDLPSTSGVNNTVSVVSPTGSPVDSTYAFTLDFGGGTTQQVLPTIREADFYNELALSGLAVSTDTNTGVVTVVLDGTAFRFKPDYFSQFTTFDDISFRSQSGNDNAAFRPVDANGDAYTDYRVIIGSSVQILYGMP